MGPIVPDKHVKFRGHHLNRSREIPPVAVGGVIFDRSSNVDIFRLEVASEVIPGAIVDPIVSLRRDSGAYLLPVAALISPPQSRATTHLLLLLTLRADR